jgi:predicted RNA polymerase sigma factor
LMLRTVCGLTASEIAAALLVPESTVAQRLVRAKRTLGQQAEPFALPIARDVPSRLDVVLRSLYLMFTEGYAATRGDAPVRHELCQEATRLSSALATIPECAIPKVFALSALFELQSSRLSARQRADGTTIPLHEQDRRLWNRDAIQRGMLWLARASSGNAISDYHLQAAIAAEHALTVDGGPTNWMRIRQHYEQLLAQNPSPTIRLNYAFAVARTDGAEAALTLLATLHQEPRLNSNHLLPAMQAFLYAELGQTTQAAAATRLALQRVRTLADRALLLERAKGLEGVSLLNGVLN